ncbi:MAG: glycosyltransferase family 2 protein [Bacteroidetes bacterium]|nr:glycosyltransferase family 2 protein [Bacteroidota bacterium]
MVKISAVIITFNEEKNISRCLESLQDIADEIVVVDSFSTDRTRDICLKSGVRFLEHPFASYNEQKNFAVSQAHHSHVLSLDADEALSPALQKSIRHVKQNWDSDGFSMNRLTNYCGKWIRHAWYPDTKLRLWDIRKGKWDDSIVHEKVVMEPGSVVKHLEGDLLHYSFYSLDEHLNQQKKFATMSANALFSNGKRSNLRKIILNPAINFLKLYLLKQGFRDGYEGYLIAKISAITVFMKYTFLMDLQRRNKKEKV